MPNPQKEAKVREIAERLSGSQAAVLAGYRGLTVQDSAELRTALGEVDTQFAVVKNTLAKIAAKEAGFEALSELVDGPVALAYVQGDPVTAVKRLVDQVKRFPVLEIRGGLAEGRVLTAADVRELATLDSREVMLAQVAGLAKMQMSRALWMFQALQSRFVSLMQALAEKLPADGAAEASVETEPAPAEPAEEPATTEPPVVEPPAEEPSEAPAEPTDEPVPAEAPAETPPAAEVEAPEAREELPEAEEAEPAAEPEAPAPEETETEPATPGGPPGDETTTEEEGGT